MNEVIEQTKIIRSRRSGLCCSFLRLGFTLIPLTLFALACFALAPTVRAVTPAPDGGYPNHNTAEGEDALLKLGLGHDNTAIGFRSLHQRNR